MHRRLPPLSFASRPPRPPESPTELPSIASLLNATATTRGRPPARDPTPSDARVTDPQPGRPSSPFWYQGRLWCRDYLLADGKGYTMELPPNETTSAVSRVTADGRKLSYRLTVIQHPKRARACGAGARCMSCALPSLSVVC